LALFLPFLYCSSLSEVLALAMKLLYRIPFDVAFDVTATYVLAQSSYSASLAQII
jgi:hypothetical protein